jgi:hypothetical protein
MSKLWPQRRVVGEVKVFMQMEQVAMVGKWWAQLASAGLTQPAMKRPNCESCNDGGLDDWFREEEAPEVIDFALNLRGGTQLLSGPHPHAGPAGQRRLPPGVRLPRSPNLRGG